MLVILTAQIGYYHDARYCAVLDVDPDFVVLSVQNEADFADFLRTGQETYSTQRLFDGWESYRRALSRGEVWLAVQRALSGLNPTIVAVAGWVTPESVAAIAWARSRRRPVVLLSESQKRDAARSVWREWIKGRVVRLCDAALVGGPAHLEYVNMLGVPFDCVFLGYDAVDNAYFAKGAQAARMDAKAALTRLALPPRYFLASARFIAKKNLPRLIAAYGYALMNRADLPDLVILGDGAERGQVTAAIAEVGIGHRVHLLGFRSYADLPALYGLSEGFVHVSTSEQWGLVINEAAASGVPIIASSACGATATLVEDGVTGFVVDADSKESISTALCRLVGMDELARKEMGKAAQRRVDNWGPERFASGLLSACVAAQARPKRGLAPWDEMLLRYLARRMISDVQ